MCALPKMNSLCTVTGPYVVDIKGQGGIIPDRCGYELVSITDVKLMGFFHDRRRKDISFLAHMTLAVKGAPVVYLGQGGMVKEDKKELDFKGAPIISNGMKFTKDPTGVTAEVPAKGISIFFDGYTAQIHITAPTSEKVGGFCANSRVSLTSVKDPKSPKGCDTKHKETAPAPAPADCDTLKKQCELLKAAPFDSCKSAVNPQYYILGCSYTMCKYPAVDGLQCQYLEAYAKACEIKGVTLAAWRTNAKCPAVHKAFCQDKHCADHEFCADNVSGGKSCFCQSVFASKYKDKKVLGDPTVCTQNSATVNLVGCLLEEKGIDFSVLHLNDKTCKGQKDDQNMVKFNFDSSKTCGMKSTSTATQIVFKNAIKNQAASGVITRSDQVNIDFSCVYTKPDIKSLTFKIKDSSVVQTFTSGKWTYTLTMKSYLDAGLTQAVTSSTEIKLDQKVWVELKSGGLDGKLVVLVTDSCWATNDKASTAKTKHELVKSGCANSADNTVAVKDNGVGVSNSFSFNMFQFSGKSGDLYLHCKVTLCVKDGTKCIPTCKGGTRRRRRSDDKDESPSLITMSWTH